MARIQKRSILVGLPPDPSAVREVRIDTLHAADYNPRAITHREEQEIRDSLREFGFQGVVVLNQFPGRENVIVGGHQRVRLWREMGHQTVLAMDVALPLEQEKKLNLRLNKAQAHFDFGKLTEFFDSSMLIDVGFENVEFLLPEPDLNVPPPGHHQTTADDFVAAAVSKAMENEVVHVSVGTIKFRIPRKQFTQWLSVQRSIVGNNQAKLTEHVRDLLGLENQT